MTTFAPLDRPVWNMLTGPQAHLAQGGDLAVRIDPDYGPFAATRDQSTEAQAALAALLVGPQDGIGLVERKVWPAPPGTRVVSVWHIVQMLAEEPAALDADDPACVKGGHGPVTSR